MVGFLADLVCLVGRTRVRLVASATQHASQQQIQAFRSFVIAFRHTTTLRTSGTRRLSRPACCALVARYFRTAAGLVVIHAFLGSHDGGRAGHRQVFVEGASHASHPVHKRAAANLGPRKVMPKERPWRRTPLIQDEVLGLPGERSPRWAGTLGQNGSGVLGPPELFFLTSGGSK